MHFVTTLKFQRSFILKMLIFKKQTIIAKRNSTHTRFINELYHMILSFLKEYKNYFWTFQYHQNIMSFYRYVEHSTT